jgi:hypothetical protein
MEKLKIFCEKINSVDSVVEEQILSFGMISQEIINKNKTFRNFKKTELLSIIEYTDIENCDFIYYPYKINRSSDIKNLINLSEQYNKKILLLYNDDDEFIFNFKNSIFFRTSLFKSNKPQNYFALPAFCNDLKLEEKKTFREKNTLPTIGFCGAITHPIRKQIIGEINKLGLPTNFIIRENFWGGDVWGSKVRSEYINNTLNSDIIICLRGAGNFSYRFYETLCLGRIPLVVDTDLVFPFEDFINYDKRIIRINNNNIENLFNDILSFWNDIQNYKLFQENTINFWEKNLSPMGFINNLNTYKHEINNILYSNTQNNV